MLRIATKIGGRRVNSSRSVLSCFLSDLPHLIELKKMRLKSKSTRFDKNSSQTSGPSPPMRNHSRLTTRTVWLPQSRWNWTVWLLHSERDGQAMSRVRPSTAKSRKKTNGSESLRGLSERGSRRRSGRGTELKRRNGKQRRRRRTD